MLLHFPLNICHDWIGFKHLEDFPRGMDEDNIQQGEVASLIALWSLLKPAVRAILSCGTEHECFIRVATKIESSDGSVEYDYREFKK